ncbi:hypothetical protein N7451_003088 [Penicillium sp. IBT 35674x]|nr:hypothetical protein N7451_003088 [Penicillium sp. IBT 35674x]
MDTKDNSVTDTGSVLHLEQPAAQVVHVEKVTEHDIVDAAARGQDSRAHYRSIQFIGTVLAQCLAQMSGYLSFNVPANILGLINDDLGGGENVNWLWFGHWGSQWASLL